MKKSKELLSFTIDNKTHSVRISGHALERAEQRGITKNIILSEIVALPIDEFTVYTSEQQDVAIIDEQQDIAIILDFRTELVNVITVINKSDIWVKEGTQIKRY